LNFSKRLFDLIFSITIAIFLAPFLLFTAIVIFVFDGRPIFYVSERMKDFEQGFGLIKFRTMRPMSLDSGVSGGDKIDRITKAGRFLRRTRLDELPQLFNVIKGDLSFVGPRPPLRQYVQKYPELYRSVLISRPGITGLASLRYHKHEERLLSKTKSSTETDEVYCRSCIPRKAHLDLIYQKNRNLCLDLKLILLTAEGVFKAK
jgi:lipopolysaccharide/colanic/teichoic acid biosynthesis glycosyltransferase